MRRTFYENIKQRLLESEALGGAIKHVDLWNRNVEFIEEDVPWARPAVFVEFRPIKWQVMSGGRDYRATGELVLHVVTDWTGSDADIAALDLSEQIHAALFNLQGDDFGKLMLIESDTNHDHEEIVENIEVYSFRATRAL